MIGATSASQAWAILKRHARDEIATLRLQDLCQDNDRVSSLVTVHNSNVNNGGSTTNNNNNNNNNSMLLIDLSRQRMTLETLNHLLKLSVTRGVRQYITRLAWGQNDPNNPLQILQKSTNSKTSSSSTTRGRSTSSSTNKRHHPTHHHHHHPMNRHRSTNSSTAGQQSTSSATTNNNNHNRNSNSSTDFPTVMPSMHLAYRAPKNQGHHMLTLDGTNALTAIHREWDRLERLSDSIRRKGNWRGANGKMIRDVVVVGRGVAIQALQFIAHALQYDENAIMATKFGLDSSSSSSFSSPSSFSSATMAAGAASNLVGFIRQTTGSISTTFQGGGGGADGSSSAFGKGGYSNNNIRPRKIHFLTSVDPLAAASLVSQLDAGSTMVISFALQGNEETGLATQTMKNWLLQELGGGSVTMSTSVGGAGGAAAGTASSSSKTTGNATTTTTIHNNNITTPLSSSSNNNTNSSNNKRTESILSKHMLLVTGNDQIVTTINKPESVFLIPEHSRCEGFISFSAATLLPMSIVYGWPICEQFLAGGHDLDCHFVESNPRHNIPVLLALCDVWNDAFLSSSTSSSPARGGGGGVGRVVTPFSESLKGFPGFVAALEAQTCSGGHNNDNDNNNSNSFRNPLSSALTSGAACCSSLVLDGGSDSAYDRALYQSPKIQYSEMIMVMNTQLKANTARTGLGGTNGQRMEDIYHHADALMCSLFGHADELAFGNNNSSSSRREETLLQQQRSNESLTFLQQQQQESSDASQRFDTAPAQQQQQANHSEGNRPSTLLICGTLDAFALGQLIACSEHRAAVKARIWDIDPFAREAGYAMRTPRAEQLRQDLEKIYLLQELGGGSEDSDDEDEDNYCGGLNLSSKTILGHYARVRS